MIVYTVQPEFLYKKMREDGYLEGDEAYAMFPEAYKWMISQMKKRMSLSFEGYPIWVWKRRPNRNERALATKGQRWVILTLDIPKEHILFSPFSHWHLVLNNSPITFDEAEWANFKEMDFPDEAVKATWERLFDWEWLASLPIEWAGDIKKEWIQGVTPRITMEHVKKVSRFIGKG